MAIGKPSPSTSQPASIARRLSFVMSMISAMSRPGFYQAVLMPSARSDQYQCTRMIRSELANDLAELLVARPKQQHVFDRDLGIVGAKQKAVAAYRPIDRHFLRCVFSRPDGHGEIHA